MQTKTWTFEDKATWPLRGPWDAEPDKMQWTDEATQLPCLAVRQQYAGHWCGYVGVAEGHPCFGHSYGHESTSELAAHGGLTFADFCNPGEKEHGICHVVEPGENDRVWWLGFDCAHCDDLSPKHRGCMGEYRTLEYVRQECAELAKQLAAMRMPTTEA